MPISPTTIHRSRASALTREKARAGSPVVVGRSDGQKESASVVVVAGESVPMDPGATVTVRLMNADGSFSGQADAKGTVQFEGDIPPGSYTVFVTVDSAPGTPTGGIDIGTALHAFSSPKIILKSGVNTINLS